MEDPIFITYHPHVRHTTETRRKIKQRAARMGHRDRFPKPASPSPPSSSRHSSPAYPFKPIVRKPLPSTPSRHVPASQRPGLEGQYPLPSFPYAQKAVLPSQPEAYPFRALDGAHVHPFRPLSTPAKTKGAPPVLASQHYDHEPTTRHSDPRPQRPAQGQAQELDQSLLNSGGPTWFLPWSSPATASTASGYVYDEASSGYHPVVAQAPGQQGGYWGYWTHYPTVPSSTPTTTTTSSFPSTGAYATHSPTPTAPFAPASASGYYAAVPSSTPTTTTSATATYPASASTTYPPSASTAYPPPASYPESSPNYSTTTTSSFPSSASNGGYSTTSSFASSSDATYPPSTASAASSFTSPSEAAYPVSSKSSSAGSYEAPAYGPASASYPCSSGAYAGVIWSPSTYEGYVGGMAGQGRVDSVVDISAAGGAGGFVSVN